jgi:hypothetical protein
MKKTLLCAALVAAGIATSVAQNVYSLNVVGYYNITIPANQLVMIANQLNTTNNTRASLLPNGPAGATLYKYSGGYTAYVFDDLDNAWTPDGNATLNPGEGAFFRSPNATTLTFVGEVMQGSLTNTTPINVQVMRSSMVPQAGGITSVLGLPGEGGDTVYKYAGGYTAYVFDDLDLAWTPSEPSFSVGEAFFLKKAPTSTQALWVRNFTVN